MDNKEYLEKIKKDENCWTKLKNLKNDFGGYSSEECNDYRQTKALEIIAEELINIRTRMESEEGVTVDVRMS